MAGRLAEAAPRVIVLPRAVRAEDKLKAILARQLLRRGKAGSRQRRYLLTFLAAIFGVWACVGGYAWLAPRGYTSQMTLNLPGAGAQSSLNLEAIGQATSSAPSPFSSASMSPKVIYKSIAESDRVRGLAAKSLGVAFADLPKPAITLIDETAIITIKVIGPSPETAQQRLTAYYAALEAQLDLLRRDEVDRRSAAIRNSLVDVERNLKTARDALVAFQTGGDIASNAQLTGMTQSLETLDLKRAELIVERERAMSEKEQLVALLGISPKLAATGLRMQADPRFLALFKAHADALALQSEVTQKWGRNHPKVIAAHNSVQSSRRALQTLAAGEFGKAEARLLDELLLTDSDGRSDLFRSLVEAEARAAGLSSQADELTRQVALLKQRTERMAASAAKLDDLERNHKIAEAVFSSALARADTNRQDIYASYPLIQVVAEPSLPPSPSFPRIDMAVAGGGVASMFLLFALALAWIRQPLLRRILKNAPSGTRSR